MHGNTCVHEIYMVRGDQKSCIVMGGITKLFAYDLRWIEMGHDKYF